MANEKTYTFSRTYVGTLGVFLAGRTYRLTPEQAETLKDFVKGGK